MESGSDAHILTDPVDSAACPKCGAILDVKGLSAFTAVSCPTCEHEFQVPARFGAFMLLQLLGAGGMGGVYRARDEGLNREVAIKVMLKSLGDDPQFVETFQREAQAAAKLNHPHIAQIYSFGQVHGQPFIVMELVSGGSLDKMMAAQGPLDPSVVVHVGAQIAEGLQEAAEAGLVHGDVKPENILFDNDKNAKLVDFGLAALSGGPGNDVWGTPFYIAPEKVRRQKSDFRSDIYSLGATLYHAIAGVPPFDGPDATAVVKARFDGPPKSLKTLRGDGVPADVDSLIARMLAVEPHMRYPTYGSLLGDMRRYLSKVGPVTFGGNTKKIMIKGKGGKSTTSGVTTMTGGITVTTGTIGDVPPGMTPVSEIPSESETQKPLEKILGLLKKNARKIAWGTGAAAVLVLVISLAVWGGKRYSESKKAEALLAQAERAQVMARASIAKSIDAAKAAVARLRPLEPEAMGYAKSAADEVVAVLGEETRARMVPPEPTYAVPDESSAPAPEPVAAPPPAAKLPAAKAAAAAAKGKGGAVPAPAASNAVPAAAKAHATDAKTAAAAKAAPAPTPALAPEAAPPPEAAATDPTSSAVATVRQMYTDAYAVKGAVLLAETLLSRLETGAKAAEALKKPEQAQALTKQANELSAKANALIYSKEIAEATSKVSPMRKTLARVRTEMATLAGAKRQESLERAQKEKEAAALEKKQQEEEARKAKAQAECAKVVASEAEALTPLKQLQFREALRVLKDLADSLETKDGLDALNAATERINRVKEFHTYLVGKVQGFKSSRGWSVESADQKTLTVGGHKIQWVEVYSTRLDIVAELINGLVMDEQLTKNMRLREKSRLITNAAVCLALFYREMPSALDRAKQLATSAAQMFSGDADAIKQLLPEFFKE